MSQIGTELPTDKFHHLVEIDETERQLTIFRVRSSGREFYTSVKLLEKSCDEDPVGAQEFCRLLGESILLDSPSGRQILFPRQLS